MFSTLRSVALVGLVTFAPAWLQGCEKDMGEDPGNRVAGGTRIDQATWEEKRDFVVYVNDGQHCCTGTVAGNVVLTAKHCVEGKSISVLTVRTAYGDRSVTRKEENTNVDVALLWLNSDGGALNTMYLSDRQPQIDDAVAITGFGTTENQGCGTLHGSGLDEIQIISCGMHSSAGVACASSGPHTISASCGGDSGGPWWRAANDAGPFYVVGVNSFGFAGDCGDESKRTGFVYTSGLRQWITTHTDRFQWGNEAF